MCGRGLTERCALKVMGMSASSLRYRPSPDRNAELRNAITTLAARHQRYGPGMIYLKLREAILLQRCMRGELWPEGVASAEGVGVLDQS